MASRTISPNAQAIRFALQCTIAPLKKAAFQHVAKVIIRRSGVVSEICAELDISPATYNRWLEAFPELLKIHEAALGGPRATRPDLRR